MRRYGRAVAELVVGTVIPATPDEVWADVEDVASHVEWMDDAVSITFRSSQTSGVGTSYDCLTRVAGIELVDQMEITAWDPGTRMGVRHVGLVTGTGEFLLSDLGNGTTGFIWRETLMFPWQLGGPVGAPIGRMLLAQVWKRNLRTLTRRFDPTRR